MVHNLIMRQRRVFANLQEYQNTLKSKYAGPLAKAEAKAKIPDLIKVIKDLDQRIDAALGYGTCQTNS